MYSIVDGPWIAKAAGTCGMYGFVISSSCFVLSDTNDYFWSFCWIVRDIVYQAPVVRFIGFGKFH